MPPPSTLSQQKFLAVGEELQSFSPGFEAYGILLNNDTGNWLSVNGTFIVPPWTYGWSQPLPGTRSVSVTILPGPSIIPSATLGTYVTLLITEERLPQSNGFTAVTSASLSAAVTIAGSVSVTGTVGISGGVDVSGSNVNAVITNTVSITGAVTITSGSVTIGGTVDVSGSNINVTNTVNISGSVSIVSGTVSISGSITVGTITAGNVQITPGSFTAGGQGVTKVSVTGTAVQLKSTTAIKVLIIKARSANVDTLYLGKSTVTNDETAGTGGLQLDPGDMVTFTDIDTANIYINGTAGDGVSYMYWV